MNTFITAEDARDIRLFNARETAKNLIKAEAEANGTWCRIFIPDNMEDIWDKVIEELRENGFEVNKYLNGCFDIKW